MWKLRKIIKSYGPHSNIIRNVQLLMPNKQIIKRWINNLNPLEIPQILKHKKYRGHTRHHFQQQDIVDDHKKHNLTDVFYNKYYIFNKQFTGHFDVTKIIFITTQH